MIQKIEIEVDIPDGWEFVAYRRPLIGDSFIPDGGSEIMRKDSPARLFGNRIIIRHKWQPPGWLRLSKCNCVKRVAEIGGRKKWFALLDNHAIIDIEAWGFPFDPPCGPEVPDDQTERTW